MNGKPRASVGSGLPVRLLQGLLYGFIRFSIRSSSGGLSNGGLIEYTIGIMLK